MKTLAYIGKSEFIINILYYYIFIFLGSGYPLYFDFIKFCGIMLLQILIVSGLFNIVTNFLYGTSCVSGDDLINKDTQCEKTFITVFSIGNKKEEEFLLYI